MIPLPILLAALLALLGLAGARYFRVIKHAHQSGKHNATPDQWRAMLTGLAKYHQVITLTECSQRRDVIAAWAEANHWHLHHPEQPGGAECAILSRRPISHGRIRRLTRLTLKSARKAPITSVIARTFGIRFDVLHTPAHTHGLRAAGKTSWPTKVYHSMLDGLRRILPAKPRTVVGDWNLPINEAAIRALLELPGLTFAVPPKPTHGDRTIDGAQTNLTVVHVETLERFPGFDHAPVSIWYRVQLRHKAAA